MIIEIVLGIVILAEGYVIWNVNRKTELLETWIENFGDKVSQVQDDLTTIDSGTLRARFALRCNATSSEVFTKIICVS